MFEIRKALKGEEEIIIDVANKAFIPERYADFDFRKVMPKVYARPNFYKDHFVVLKDNQIIGVSGNLIRCLSLNNKCYKYSMVGSVSTLPDYRNLGVMRQMMSSIEKENEESDVVFSILTGVRKRYNWHNYEKATQRIVFNFQDYLIHHSNNDLVSLKLYEDSMLDDLYNVYLRNQILSLRKKEDFIISLKRSDAVIFGIVLEDKIIGYFAFSLKKEKITEIYIDDTSFLEDVIKKVMITFNLKEIDVVVNPLDRKMVEGFDAIAEERKIIDYAHIRIYKIKEFIELVVNLNLKIKNISSLNEVYKIDDKIIEINIENNKAIVKEVNKEYLKEFSTQEFTRYMLGFDNLYLNESKLFPLIFELNEADLF